MHLVYNLYFASQEWTSISDDSSPEPVGSSSLAMCGEFLQVLKWYILAGNRIEFDPGTFRLDRRDVP